LNESIAYKSSVEHEPVVSKPLASDEFVASKYIDEDESIYLKSHA